MIKFRRKRGNSFKEDNVYTANEVDQLVEDAVQRNLVIAWENIPGAPSQAVESVFGRTGHVVAEVGDYSEFYGRLNNDNTWNFLNTFSNNSFNNHIILKRTGSPDVGLTVGDDLDGGFAVQLGESALQARLQWLEDDGEYRLVAGGAVPSGGLVGHIHAGTFNISDNVVINSTRRFFPVDIESNNWTGEEFLSTGYSITLQGHGTFESLLVRGAARFQELIIDQLSAVGGRQLLSYARGKIAEVDEGNSTITLEDPNNNQASQWAVNDLFWIQEVDIDGAEIVSATGTVTNVSGHVLTLSFETGGINNLRQGQVVVQRGNTTNVDRQSLIYQSIGAFASSGPFTRYMRGVDSLSAFTDQAKVTTQTGYLENLTDVPDFDEPLEGSGLYAQRGYIGGDVLIRGNLDVDILPGINALGLVGDWHLDGDVDDATDFGEMGSLNLSEFVSGVAGLGVLKTTTASTHAILWSGSASQYNFDNEDSFTFAGSFRLDAGTTGSIFMKGQGSTSFGLDFFNGSVRGGVNAGSSQTIISHTVDLSEIHRYMVVVDREQETIFLYVDGVLVGLDTYNINDDFSTSGTLRALGNSTLTGAGSACRGFLDELRIWNRALSRQEAKADYLSPDGVGGGKITAHRMETGLLQSQNLETDGDRVTEGTRFDLNTGVFRSASFELAAGVGVGGVTGVRSGTGSDMAFFAGADDEIGTNATFSVDANGKIFHSSIAHSLFVRESAGNPAPPLTNMNVFTLSASRSGLGITNEEQVKFRRRYFHRDNWDAAIFKFYCRAEENEADQMIANFIQQVILKVFSVTSSGAVNTELISGNVIVPVQGSFAERDIILDLSSLNGDTFYELQILLRSEIEVIDQQGTNTSDCETFLREDFDIIIGT